MSSSALAPAVGTVTLDDRLLLTAYVAVSCCASRAATAPDVLGSLEPQRVPLGRDFDALARRLQAVRRGDAVAGATVWPRLRLVTDEPFTAEPPSFAAATLQLSAAERRILRVALQRLRGLVGLDGLELPAAVADTAGEALELIDAG